MDSETWQLVDRLLEEALCLPAAQRDRWLAPPAVSGGDFHLSGGFWANGGSTVTDRLFSNGFERQR